MVWLYHFLFAPTDYSLGTHCTGSSAFATFGRDFWRRHTTTSPLPKLFQAQPNHHKYRHHHHSTHFRPRKHCGYRLNMSSSQQRGERVVHQDFIARIRYSNGLPPPPMPCKLLDIPNTGLASGQYTTPGFASRLAREQPLNIEVDFELGMPLDLVGMPGIFDGDESCTCFRRHHELALQAVY